MVSIGLGDIFGFLSLIFFSFSALLIARKNNLIRVRLLRGPLDPNRILRRRKVKGRLLYLTNLGLVRRGHTFVAMLGGLFLVLHVAYLISYPLNGAIVLGYLAGAVIVALGITGTSYLQNFREVRFYHGATTLPVIALMVVHAAGSGFNLPVWIATLTLSATAVIVITYAGRQAFKMFR